MIVLTLAERASIAPSYLNNGVRFFRTATEIEAAVVVIIETRTAGKVGDSGSPPSPYTMIGGGRRPAPD